MSENWLVNDLIIDPKRIELFCKVHKHKSQLKHFKVTPTVLKKLENQKIEAVLPRQAHMASTSSNYSDSRKRPQRKRNADAGTKRGQTCSKCQGKLFRVVHNPKPGKRNIIECMRRDCLATFNLTDEPVGTIIGRDSYTPNSYLRDPLRTYYPTNEDIRKSLQQISKEPECLRSNVLENERGVLLISVPGQIRKAKLM